ATTVTLAVTQKGGLALAVAKERGTISLMLRSPDGVERSSRTDLSVYDLSPDNFAVPRRGLLYQRPAPSDPSGFFNDLLALAPGMNTTAADVAAVLEAEAGVGQFKPGKIEPAARVLIDKARAIGWRKLNFGQGADALTVLADGAGRFCF